MATTSTSCTRTTRAGKPRRRQRSIPLTAAHPTSSTLHPPPIFNIPAAAGVAAAAQSTRGGKIDRCTRLPIWVFNPQAAHTDTHTYPHTCKAFELGVATGGSGQSLAGRTADQLIGLPIADCRDLH